METRRIYLLATNTKKPISRVITAVTGEEFNHASVAFDLGLIECYSFSMGRAGFVREAPGEWPSWTVFELWAVEVPRASADAARRYIRETSHSGKGFSYGGLVGVVLNRPIVSEEAMFCSEFVERTCLAAGLPPSAPNPALATPAAVVRRRGAKKIAEGRLHQHILARHSSRQSLVAEYAELSIF